MSRLFLLVLLAAAGWYGYGLYTRGALPDHNNLSLDSFRPGGSSDATERGSPVFGQAVKCITADGRVIYGDLPAGTVCQSVEAVDGSLTVIGRDGFVGKLPQEQPVSGATGSGKVKVIGAAASSRFSCDGRTRCSQMTSCAEATYFLEHCPGTEMDGDNDGIACEMQWCQ